VVAAADLALTVNKNDALVHAVIGASKAMKRCWW